MECVFINNSQIEWETEKAMLIKIPKSSYRFWYPKVFIQACNNKKTRYRVALSDEFEYRLFKKGDKIYNKYKKTYEKSVSKGQMMQFFGLDIEDDYIIDDLIDD